MTDLSYIIPPVDRALLKAELSNRNLIRRTNNGDKSIYVTTAHHSPNIMREIGRLRELSFASEGGGSGNPCDIDEYDLLPEPYCYKQLFVWSDADEEIVGGYRFLHGSNIKRGDDGTFSSPTATIFDFSDDFVENVLPYTVELGRAFVQPNFQPRNNLRKGIYSLDNLWDGLGALALEVPETRYFFGKITMYPQFNSKARDLILFFYKKHFPDPDGLVHPHIAVPIESDYNELHSLFNGANYKEDYQILQRNVRALGCTIPPLINAYMGLTPTMRSFGTALCPELGGTIETGILVTLRDIYPDKRARYMESYTMRNRLLDRLHYFQINMRRMPWWRKKADNPDQHEELKQLKKLQKRRLERRQHREERQDHRKQLRAYRREVKEQKPHTSRRKRSGQ
ncbi:MAG: GNAT family N-acetyltransferase [Bacteroidales bacterium]|nr:GNAT family N-acetyltransferase [Bacteroidales bacterium]